MQTFSFGLFVSGGRDTAATDAIAYTLAARVQWKHSS